MDIVENKINFYAQLFQRTLPMRHKEVHVINVPPSLKFALDFGMSLISDKIKKRVKVIFLIMTTY